MNPLVFAAVSLIFLWGAYTDIKGRYIIPLPFITLFVIFSIYNAATVGTRFLVPFFLLTGISITLYYKMVWGLGDLIVFTAAAAVFWRYVIVIMAVSLIVAALAKVTGHEKRFPFVIIMVPTLAVIAVLELAYVPNWIGFMLPF